MLRRVLVLLALLASMAAPARADVPETPRFRIVGAAQGLPSTDLYGMARDHAGFIWIATSDGLARYDGLGMRVWRHDPADPASLPGNAVQAVYVDDRDRVWVAVENSGLSMLDGERRGFRHIRKADHPQMGSDDVLVIVGRGDDLWFGNYDGGLNHLDAAGRVTHYGHDDGDPDSLPSDIVMSLAFDAKGWLWIGGFPGLAMFDGQRIHRIALPGVDKQPVVLSVTRDGDALMVGTYAGVFRREADGRWTRPDWSPMFERPNTMTKFARDRGGALWIGSQRGLWRMRPGSVPVPVALGGPGIAKPISTMLLQDDGALWVSVAGAGLGYLRSDWRRIAIFSRMPDGLQGDLYRALAPASGGGLWLGGYNGAVEHVDAAGDIRKLDDAQRERLKDTRIFAVAEDHEGRLWLGYNSGLIRVGNDGAIDDWNMDSPKDPTLPRGADLLRVADDGTLWTSYQGGGIQQRDPATGKVLAQVAVDEDKDTGLGVGDTEAMEFASDGRLWIAGASGVSRLDDGATRFVPVPGMAGGRVYGFAFDGADVAWLQRLSGLERYRREGDAWRRTGVVDGAQGLPAVGAGGVRVDRRHRVWMSTSRGLFRWDPQAKVLRRYGLQAGLGSQEFLDRAITLTRDGILAASTADGGVVLIDTMGTAPPSPTPVLGLDSFSVRRNGTWQALALDGAIEVPPDDRELRIRSRLLAYDDPSSNRYWSRLVGFDGGWVAQGASAERTFTGLAAGDYVLRVRATNAAGIAAREQRLHFAVLPPWWGTTWARVLFALALLALLGGVAVAFRRRLRRRNAWHLNQHKRELAEQASQAKTRFLATLGHEVRTPMTGVLGMSELLMGTDLDARQRGYTESIRRAGDHLMRLVNDALDLARIEAGKLELDPQPFDLHALVGGAIELAAPLARQRGLRFVAAIAPDAPRWLRGDAVRIRQILLNLLGNAIKFTEHGEVSLDVAAMPVAGLRIVVGDTGPGLNDEQKQRLFRRFEQADGARTAARYGGSGLGLAICQELSAVMGGRIEVDSEPGRGTRFIVELPMEIVAEAQMPSAADVLPAATSRAALDLLLVEDDPTVAEVIAGLLRAQGHRVVHVVHGLAALSEIASARFDLALLDLDLPGIDGLALAQQLRAHGFMQPLLAVTARADADAEPQAREAGFDGFLRKPLTGAMLADAIEVLLPEGERALP